jgi:DNA-binding transcriptional MerR regulator
MNKTYKIKDLAEIFDLTTRTLRFWEEKNLLSSLLRVSGKRRVYGEDIIKRIKEIQRYKSKGLSLDDIKEVLDKKEKKSSSDKNKTRILLGSSSTIEENIMEKYDIDFIPSYIHLDSKKYIDGFAISDKNILNEKFNDVLIESPTKEDFVYYYSEMYREGATDVIVLLPSEAYGTDLVNAKNASVGLSEINIHVIDTCSFGQIETMLAIIAREKISNGLETKNVVKYLQQLIADHLSFMITSSIKDMLDLNLLKIDFQETVNPLYSFSINHRSLFRMNNQTDNYEIVKRESSFDDLLKLLINYTNQEIIKNQMPIIKIGISYTCKKDKIDELEMFLKKISIPVFWQKSNFYMSAKLGSEAIILNIIKER